MDEKLAGFAENLLKKRGVDVRLGVRLEAATADEAILDDGSRIPTKTIVSTVPASPHPIVESLDLPKAPNGKIKVTSGLEVEGSRNVWALGDCALVPAPKGGFAPPTAQHAIRQAATAAHNIVAEICGTGVRKAFDFEGLGKLGALGHRSAVAEVMGVKLSGFVAWWMWRTIYLMKLPGWGRRLKVAVSWTLDLLLPAELVQLKIDPTPGMAHEHFEPGQTVFSQGDVGDRVFIIVSGEVDVVRHEMDGERRLARLGAGEYFGEMALLNNSTRNATVRAATSADVLSLPKHEFGALAANLPELRASFEAVMRRRTEARVESAATY
jgi:NADH dehydrogenase